MKQHFGIGRRKTSRARVRIVPAGSGKRVINKTPCEEYEPSEFKRNCFLEPLAVMPEDSAKKIDIFVIAEGGGTAGQNGAIRLGIARALEKMNPTFRKELKAAGFLMRDSREKERKKTGIPKARKRKQFSKR